MSFPKKLKSFLKIKIGTLAALFLYRTLRMTWRLDEEAMPPEVLKRIESGEPVVLAHFHEDEWALLGFCEKKNHNVLVCRTCR